MNDKIYNIVTKKYSSFIKINKNIDLGTYYNLYDDNFNFLQKFQKEDLQSILNKYKIKYNNIKFQQTNKQTNHNPF